MRLLRTVILAIAVTCCLTGAAGSSTTERKVRFGHITVEDGLSHTWVQSILKDSRGFLWFGTQHGLNRYDGENITVYPTRPGDPHGLPAPIVSCLYEDSHRRLWLAVNSSTALGRYEQETDTFHFYPTADGPRSLGAQNIHAMLEDRQGRLWLATASGLRSLDVDTGVFTRYGSRPNDPTSLPHNSVEALLEDRQGRLWVGTQGGLAQLDRRSGRFVRIPMRTEPPGPENAQVFSLVEDGRGLIWIATLQGGLVRHDPATGAMRRYLPIPSDPTSLSQQNVRRLALGPPGILYVGTENGGLDALDLTTERFSRFKTDPADDASLNSSSVYSLLYDDQGILWIGTFNGGVNFLSPARQRFGLLKPGREQLSDPHVSAVLEDHQGILWIGTDGGGLNYWDRKTDRFKYYVHDARDPASIGSDAVLALYQDHQQRLWLGTWEGGLNLLDPRTGRCTRYRHDANDPTSLVNDSVWVIREDGPNRFLVGTHTGVDVFDATTGRFARLSSLYPSLTPGGSIRAIAKDRQGDIWIGSTSGVYHIDVRTGQTTRCVNDPNDPHSLSASTVRAIHLDSRGNLWLGSDGGGLNCRPIGSTDHRFRRFTTADGLSDDTVVDILEDAAGNLWLGTARGLSEFENAVDLPERPRFLNYDFYDGLQGYEFNAGAAYRSPSGELFFGGQRGLSFFLPADIRLNTKAPPVRLTGLEIFNRLVSVGGPGSPLATNISDAKELRLSYKQSVVTFHFAALDYLLPQKNQHAYRLEGFDPDWNYVGRRRSATYTSLPPGRYVFHVRGSNNDGVWNDEGVALKVIVTPPFWNTWWFRALAVLVLAGLVLWGVRLRIRASEARRRELETVVDQRTAELKREMGEHQRTEERLQQENEQRRRAEQEVHVAVERLAQSNAELTERQEALTRENTERRRAEEDAGRERDLLHALMDNIPDLIYFKDTESRFARINQAQAHALGLGSPAEAVGRTDSDFLPEEFARASREDERAIFASGRPLTGKLDYDARRGRWYLATKVPLRNGTGQITGLVGISKDITERRLAEERLDGELKAFLGVVSAVAEGDLTLRGAEGEETLGRIARSVNSMLEHFGAILEGVCDTAFSVSASSSQILAAATEIAKGAQYGSDQVLAASSAVDEMAASMAQVSRNATASLEKARHVLEHVRSGDRSVDATNQGMVKIDAAVMEMAEKMRLLERRSREIFEIVGLIEEIASQSKLLSLNAAIEAAHAGDAGRGFAVVAEEVRRLADRSDQATKEVSGRVEGIVQETQTVLQAMENALREVRNGHDLSEQARRSLQEISTLAQDSLELSLQISGASDEQAAVTKTVAETMQTITNVSTQSAVGANETSRAVKDLVHLSDQLNQAISRFRISGRKS